MGNLADVTLGDIARAIGRYRPFLVAIAVLLVALQVLPERAGDRVVPIGRQGEDAGTAGGPDIGSDEDSAAGDGEGGDTEGVPEDDAALGGDGAAFEDGGAFEEDAGFEDDEFAFDGDDSDGGSDFEEVEDDAGAGGESDGDGEFGSLEDDQFVPLFVSDFGWATVTAGTPLASSDVPEGSMPVGKRVGQDDKIAYVRLIGTADVLELPETSGGQRTPPVGDIGVRLCQSEDADWTSGGGKTFDEAPSYDDGACVDGERSEDGVWTFDLSRFDDPEDRRGFVLVPGPDSAVDFQVAFNPYG